MQGLVNFMYVVGISGLQTFIQEGNDSQEQTKRGALPLEFYKRCQNANY